MALDQDNSDTHAINPGVTDADSQNPVLVWLSRFEKALNTDDVKAVLHLFHDNCFWRDLASITWNVITFEGKSEIEKMLGTTHFCKHTRTYNWQLRSMIQAGSPSQAFLKFETAHVRGLAVVMLEKSDGGEMLCRNFLTAAQELKGYEELNDDTRPLGDDMNIRMGRESWVQKRLKTVQEHRNEPYVVIIGGGQAGIILGARLERLNVPYVILDKHARPGDTWRNRYNTLCLHDPIWYNYLPYIPFPDHWPVYISKDRMADFLESYVKSMDLNYWGNVNCLNADFDEEKKKWSVSIEDKSNKNKKHTITNVGHVVFATGVSGLPNVPEIKGRDSFKGKSWHSSEHPGGAGWKGKNVVVVGSNNSAHDICTELWEHGANVKMVQRSSTHIVKSKAIKDVLLGDLYSEKAVKAGLTADVSDLMFASYPFKVVEAFHKMVFDGIRAQDAKFYEQLKNAGFMLDFGADDSGVFMKYLRRGSGYYIDTGGSQLIIDGKVELVHGEIKEMNEHGILLNDEQQLDADLIVFATGYGPMNQFATQIVGAEISKKVGRCWGLGSDTAKDPGPWEGELRNMYKPTQQEGMWYFGGNFHQCRHYSLCLALQLKARFVGIPVPVYKLQQVYHEV